jgi:hypothetical protein
VENPDIHKGCSQWDRELSPGIVSEEEEKKTTTTTLLVDRVLARR